MADDYIKALIAKRRQAQSQNGAPKNKALSSAINLSGQAPATRQQNLNQAAGRNAQPSQPNAGGLRNQIQPAKARSISLNQSSNMQRQQAQTPITLQADNFNLPPVAKSVKPQQDIIADFSSQQAAIIPKQPQEKPAMAVMPDISNTVQPQTGNEQAASNAIGMTAEQSANTGAFQLPQQAEPAGIKKGNPYDGILAAHKAKAKNSDQDANSKRRARISQEFGIPQPSSNSSDPISKERSKLSQHFNLPPAGKSSESGKNSAAISFLSGMQDDLDSILGAPDSDSGRKLTEEEEKLLNDAKRLKEENEELKKKLESASAESASMNQFVNMFFNQDTVENALDIIFSSLKNFMRCEAVEFIYLDEPQELIFLYSLTRKGIYQWEDYVAYKGTDFEPIIAAQKPDIIGDLSIKDDYPVTGLPEEFKFKSLLRMPCASAESFVGFLDIYASPASSYSQEDIQKAAPFAIAAAFFFENMFLKEKLSYIRENSVPKPDREYMRIREYLEKEFEKALSDIDENANNMKRSKFGRLVPQQYESLTNIEDYSQNIRKCSGYLQEYMAFTAGQIQPQITRIDIKKLLDDVTKHMKPKVDAKTSKMMVEIDQKKPPQILGDYKMMLRILVAFLENALEATKIGGVFRISVYTDEDMAEFAVFDFSEDPIPAEELGTIFEPFGVMKTAINKKKTKVFLNLPMVKMYADSMGGKISITSTKEDGTMVSLKMPFAPKR